MATATPMVTEDSDGDECNSWKRGQSREGMRGGARETRVGGIEEENGFQMGLDGTRHINDKNFCR